MALVGSATTISRADEQLFGFVRGAETLPKGRSELYQFLISTSFSIIAIWASPL